MCSLGESLQKCVYIQDKVDVCSCVLKEHSRACVRGRVQVKVSRLLGVSVSESGPSTPLDQPMPVTGDLGQASVSGATYWLQTHKPSLPERWGPAALPR